MNDTISIFDILYPKYNITKPIRLIEMFSGYGSQALALKYLGVPFEHWKICEWAVKSIQAYKDIHFENDNTDYSKDLSKLELIDYLHNKGISSDYNKPINYHNLFRLSEDNLRTIYNNIIATHNLVNIQQVKGKDLEIIDTDKYDYILTYSFPCQDLSLAGKGKGMSDTSTRSGMLWEVERILTECKEIGQLPRILLMENVPQVHGEGNVQDFAKWINSLEKLGYKSYYKDLIATDYGIPQTRNRCFMVSLLGDYNYTFPKSIPLKLKLKDLLEENVDEKYYLSDKMINCFLSENEDSKFPRKERFLQTFNTTNEKGIAATITTCAGTRATDNFIKIKNATKQGYLEATDGDGVDISSRMEHHRGTVQKGKTQTITTSGGNDRGVVVGTYDFSSSERFLNGKERFEENKGTFPTLRTTPKEGVVTIGNYSPSNHNASRIVDQEYSAPTVMENHGTITATQTSDLRIRKLTPKECFRLMGVKDEEFDKVKKNQSDSSLYHLAGDSIVVNVLMAIFNELLESKGE